MVIYENFNVDLDKKVAIITGALGDIGIMIVFYLYNNGYNVIGIDIKELPQKYEPFFYKYFIIDLSAVELSEQFDELVPYRIDTIIHTAAIQVEHKIEDVSSIAMWDKVMNTNVKSIYQLMIHSFERLRETKGNVVIISSIHAYHSSRNVGLYAISKSALVSLIRNFALEWASYGIRVNGVAPGAIKTSMLMSGITRRGDTEEEALIKLISKHPLDKIGEPSDVAEYVLFLCDNSKSGFITGQNCIMDGGVSLLLSSES